MMIRSTLTTLLAALLFACLPACSFLQHNPSLTQVPIARGVDFQLALPAGHFYLTQRVTAVFRGETLNLLLQIQNDQQGLVIAGLSLTGTRLFTAQFDGEHISSWQSPLFTAPFEARFLLADFLLAQLDANSAQKQLSAGGALHEEHRQRIIANRNNKTIIDIHYSDVGNSKNPAVDYCHRERDYCLAIETLSREVQP